MILEKHSLISSHVIQFCRFLRQHQYRLGPLEEGIALRALKTIPYDHPSYFKGALKSTLVKNKPQLDQFDDLYLKYWSEVRRAENSKEKKVEESKEQPKPKQAPSLQVIKKWLYSNRENEEVSISSFDQQEAHSQKDFTGLSSQQFSELQKRAKEIVKKLSNKKGRRYISTHSKKNIDLRKIIRKNIGRTDELIYLKFKKRKIEKVNLVLICDVSRSMELYTTFLIQFLYSINQASTQIETFVFSTRLARITKYLKNKDFHKVLSELKNSFDGWSGGTKIGQSLWEFADGFALPLLNQKSKVIILSDGWDTGDHVLVSAAMEKIKRNADKVIWLNPLAGNPGFKPETACLTAALPYIDIFQAANSADDLLGLLQKL